MPILEEMRRKEFLEATMDALGWDEKKIFGMGLHAPKLSIVMKLFFGSFLTTEKVFKVAPDMRVEHYSPATLKVDEV